MLGRTCGNLPRQHNVDNNKTLVTVRADCHGNGCAHSFEHVPSIAMLLCIMVHNRWMTSLLPSLLSSTPAIQLIRAGSTITLICFFLPSETTHSFTLLLGLLISAGLWLQDLMHMVAAIKQLQAGERLQGGDFNNDSIFQPVYQMLLALHTAAFCCLLARVKLPSNLSLFQHAAEELLEVTLHPVLAAMLANTMAVWNASEADITRKVSLAYPHVFVTTL